jgi:H+/Cl- antiporter ClcA
LVARNTSPFIFLLAPVVELGADVAKLVVGVLLGGEGPIRQAAVLLGQQAGSVARWRITAMLIFVPPG